MSKDSPAIRAIRKEEYILILLIAIVLIATIAYIIMGDINCANEGFR